MLYKVKKILIMHSFIAFLAGIVFGLFHYEYLFWQTTPAKQYVEPVPISIHKKASVFYQKDGIWQEEEIIIDAKDLQEAFLVLVQHWLTSLQEEGSLSKTIALQNALLDASCNGLYVSFDTTLFFKNSSTYEKILLISSLSKTVASLSSCLQRYMLLVNHHPLADNHIDCNEPFYISYWSTLIV